MIYVIAGNSAQFERWQAENPGPAREVLSSRTFAGLRFQDGDRIDFAGTWWRRVDLQDIVGEAWTSCIIARRPVPEVYEALAPFVKARVGT